VQAISTESIFLANSSLLMKKRVSKRYPLFEWI
jgi:hypothetical protein